MREERGGKKEREEEKEGDRKKTGERRERERDNGDDDFIVVRASYSHSEKNTDNNRDQPNDAKSPPAAVSVGEISYACTFCKS